MLAGRVFGSLAELDDAFIAWAPIRRRQVHRTHGEVIAVRAERDRVALAPLPDHPYAVTERHLRRVGKDCLVSFDAHLYSVPARRVRPGQLVELRITRAQVAIHAQDRRDGPATLLAVHDRATAKGSWMVDEAHGDGLPDGRSRSTTTTDPAPTKEADDTAGHRDEQATDSLSALLARTAAARVPVGRRPLAAYDLAAGLQTLGVT
ncbi:Integrase catalytic region [Carbonactinospora thermoautotrophica]|uniref:Integrase catalytic region n=1 Tax=Carbonactinospora thermoautotrophica TaxID=1469144 RepID=A0A132MSI9_9ACTN|nr:Integrase catalytic region [Carbonactinospora thermoautotrophica]